ncbi:MAG: dimethylsulfoxide reductase subunit B [Syntrophomonadaceae bacterium]|nr:dimethylsulfoxide reductase subunit B [Syntrophomonadaceae bacterium]
MSKQLAFYFEQKYCTGCKTCQIACKDKNNLELGQLYRKVKEISGGGYQENGPVVVPDIYAFWISISCNHCLYPACVKSCPVGALQKRAEDGIVMIDKEKCAGCRSCIKACPYEALLYDPDMKKAGKCDFCYDMLAQGKQPVCVSACPMRALNYGLMEELQQKYGTCNQTKGMPDAEVTQPALVITPHRDAFNGYS